MSGVQIRVFGPGVTAERVTEIGEAYCALHHAVAQSLGYDGVGLEVTGVEWCCDGCDARAPSRPSDWLNAGVNDYCSRCQRERGL